MRLNNTIDRKRARQRKVFKVFLLWQELQEPSQLKLPRYPEPLIEDSPVAHSPPARPTPDEVSRM